LAGQLLDRVIARGELTPAWSKAFAAVLRHRFIPDTIWITDGAGLVPLDRHRDPHEWLQRAYAPAAVITQVDDGHPAGPGERGRYITSSASHPGVVALMLAALDAEPGRRVLEIGTGTGYHAALLAHRLGAGTVTSIEIDSRIAEHARRALASTGYPVTVITGDGAEDYSPLAPYDRIMSTAAVRQVPYAWIEQTHPGGMILTRGERRTTTGRWPPSPSPARGPPRAASWVRSRSCGFVANASAPPSRMTSATRPPPAGAAPP
jgi:protein-L-isoaspartate O-methyltransferase